MEGLPPGCFPFHGKCDCSSGGDVQLVFKNGSSFTTHGGLLSVALPTFKTIFTECTDSGTLKMEKTSRTAWMYLLNMLHPAVSPASVTLECLTSTATVVTEF